MSSEDAKHRAAAVFTATAVAARLGVAVETLRTWDRRYGIGPSAPEGRGSGGRRRYGEADVARLLAMRRLVAAGASPSDAARQALSEERSGSPADDAVVPPPSGSRVGQDAQRGLLNAATALDAATVARLLGEAVAVDGVERSWNELLAPLLVQLGDRWEATGQGVDTEHLVSQVASNVLRAVVVDAAEKQRRSAELPPESHVRPPVLLAAVDGEQHVLTLDVLAALLAQQGRSVVSLGASTPVSALDAVARRLRPDAVFVWARVPGPTVTETATAIGKLRPTRARRTLRLVVGGNGWRDVELPEGVRLVANLAEARAALEI